MTSNEINRFFYKVRKFIEMCIISTKKLFSIKFNHIKQIFLNTITISKKKVNKSLFLVNKSIRSFVTVNLLVLFLLEILVFILCFSPFLPDVQIFKEVSTFTALISTIILGLASILGIIIAIILVVFQLLRQTFSGYAIKVFFSNIYLRRLVVLFISTIIIATLTFFLTDSIFQTLKTILVIYDTILFFICLLLLYPYSRKIISTTHLTKEIHNLIKKISYKDIYLIGDRWRPYDIQLAIAEENPIFILTDAAIKAMYDGDYLTPKKIIIGVAKKIINYIHKLSGQHDYEVRTTINGYMVLFKDISEQAIKLKSDGIIQTIIIAYEGIHNACAIKKIPWSQLIEFNDEISNIISKTIDADLDIVSKNGLYSLLRIYNKHIALNIPNENKIWIFTKNVKHDDESSKAFLQWNNVALEFLFTIAKVIEKAVEKGKTEIVESGLSVFAAIIRDVMMDETISKKLGDQQKMAIIRFVVYDIESIIKKSIKDELWKRKTLYNPYDDLLILNSFEKNAVYAREIIISFTGLLLLLADNELLSLSWMNTLSILGTMLIDKINEADVYEEAFNFIIKVMTRLRAIIEKKETPVSKGYYIELYRELDWLIKSSDKLQNKPHLIKELKDAIAKFTKIEDYQKILQEGKIDWTLPTKQKSK